MTASHYGRQRFVEWSPHSGFTAYRCSGAPRDGAETQMIDDIPNGTQGTSDGGGEHPTVVRRTRPGRPRHGDAVARHLPRDEELLRIAAEVFAERGFERTKVSDIAKRAGIVPGSIYHYFRSKEDIYGRLMEWILQGRQLETLPDDLPPLAHLVAFVRTRTEQFGRYPLETGLLRRSVSLDGELGEWGRRHARNQFDQLRRIIVQGQRAGVFRPGDPDIITRLLTASFADLMEWYRPEGRVVVDDLVDEVVAFVVSAVTGRPSDETIAAESDNGAASKRGKMESAAAVKATRTGQDRAGSRTASKTIKAKRT
jgi:TetR/AcrR family transcriptional regulator, cholesterol catabolism regulator